MEIKHYILDENGEVKAVDDLLVWAEWIEDSKEKRRVDFTEVGKYHVSTVFMGLDHSFGQGEPVLFETMVFENELSEMDLFGKKKKYQKSLDIDGAAERYCTKDEAIAGHKKIVKLVEDFQKPPEPVSPEKPKKASTKKTKTKQKNEQV